MNFSTGEITEILFGNIQNKTHWKERRSGVVKYLIKNGRNLLANQKKYKQNNRKGILFFSTPRFFSLPAFYDYELYYYKEKLDVGAKLSFEHEEYLLFLSMFLPFARKKIFQYVYKRCREQLNQLNLEAFVCNQPELINHIIAVYCKEKNIKIITMQHGIYMPSFYTCSHYEKNIADYNFVWGEVYKECYMRSDVKEENIAVVSPPIIVNIQVKDAAAKTPVFLGQQLYKINDKVYDKYNKAIAALIKKYNALGIKVFYKPHPREDINRSLSKENRNHLDMLGKKSVVNDFFATYNIAYSVNSTSLIHAYCAGMECYQVDLEIPDLPNQLFNEYTNIPAVKIGQIEAHGFMNSDELSNRYISDKFIHITSTPQIYNSDILLNILSTKNN